MNTNKFLHNERGDMNMVNTGIYLVVLLVVLYVGINIVANVQTATDVAHPVAATGTLTCSSPSADNETITISGVVFELNLSAPAATAGRVEVNISDSGTLPTVTNLTVAINANETTSALVTAANTSTTVVLTADTAGSGGNSITTTDTLTNGDWGAPTLTGGAQSGAFYDTQQAMVSTTESSYSMAGIMPIVMIAVAVLGGLLSVLYLFAKRE